MSGPELAALTIADPPERWEALGFAVRDGAVELGGVMLQLGASGQGIRSWTLRGIELSGEIDVDGLSTDVTSTQRSDDERVAEHPNGAIALDHVVILTGDFDRTAQALTASGMPLRREAERGGARQGFRRLGPAILELVQAPGATRFWGLVVVVRDLDELAERLGSHLAGIRPAVQPGRHIAPLRSSAGLTPAVAFMDPEPE